MRPMRDSGIVYLGKIPSDWTVTPAKHVLIKQSRPLRPDDEIVICSNRGKVVFRGEKNPGLVSMTESGYQGVNPGDLLIHGMDTWHGAIAVSEIKGKCTGVVHVCESSEDKKYIAYYLQSLAFRNVYKAFSNGVRQNTSDFRSWQKTGEIPLVLPPRDEQRRLSEYLDAKCNEIDKAISAAEASISEYELYKKSLVFHAVTKGLSPSVYFVDSGIDWVGDIPAHWQKSRWKYLLTERVEKNDPIIMTEILSLSASQGVVPYSERKGGGNKAKSDLSAYKIARRGDIVLNSMNVVSGSVALSQYDGCVSPVYYMYYSAADHVDIEYFNLLFQIIQFQKSLFGLGNGIMYKESSTGKLNTVRMRIPAQVLSSLWLPVPPLNEQHQIVEWLNGKIVEIEKNVEAKQGIIEELRAYKKSLIYEVVTGKREVR